MNFNQAPGPNGPNWVPGLIGPMAQMGAQQEDAALVQKLDITSLYKQILILAQQQGIQYRVPGAMEIHAVTRVLHTASMR